MLHVKKSCKYLILFLIGAFAYCGIEIIWRGYTHWTMGMLGGTCFILIGLINNSRFFYHLMPFREQMVLGGLIVTVMEFIAGCILNLWLGLGIWDYSQMPFNLCGQICLPYTILWILLSAVCIVVDDWLRYLLFVEEKPEYIW